MRKYKILVAIVISFFPFNIINAQSICISTYHSNVLYDQIPNHVSVNIGSLSCKLLSLESEDLIISHLGECDYILNTKRKGKVSLTVKIKRTHNRIPIIKKLIFEVQEFPEPKFI